MKTPQFETCKLCHVEFMSHKDLKNGICRSCELSTALRNFFFALCESLKIDKFTMWLAEKLKKKEPQQ